MLERCFETDILSRNTQPLRAPPNIHHNICPLSHSKRAPGTPCDQMRTQGRPKRGVLLRPDDGAPHPEQQRAAIVSEQRGAARRQIRALLSLSLSLSISLPLSLSPSLCLSLSLPLLLPLSLSLSLSLSPSLSISRFLKNISLFCKRTLQKRPIFCKRDQ